MDAAAILALAETIQAPLTVDIRQRIAGVATLAHYTSFEALSAIVRSNEIWFSCVRDMNDISEMTSGATMVAAALELLTPQLIKSVPTEGLKISEAFAMHRSVIENETYAFSLSDHGQDGELDRLMMWRAYGQNGHGVCAVFHKEALLGQDAKGTFMVHWSPIEYEPVEHLNARVTKILTYIEGAFRAQPDLVKRIPPNFLGLLVALFTATAIFGHKHVGFRDEREIRFSYCRLFQARPLPQGAGIREIATAPIPKKVFVLPLRNYPEFGVKAALPELLDHVIVGPSTRQSAMADDIRRLLDDHGLSHVGIRLSELPYRATQR